MTAKTFTILNNGNTNLSITSITFNTPAGIRHSANLTNFGASSTFTGNNFIGSTALNTGSSITFSVDHEYVSGPMDVRNGTILVNSNLGAIATITTTIIVGTGGIVSLVNPLPGQGTYVASKTNPVDGRSYITLTLSSEGTLTINSVDGTGLNSNWLTPFPTAAGSGFWVRFTRSGFTGTGNYTSSGSTGWLQLDQSRFVEVSATGLSNGTASTSSATYLVEISSNGGTTVSASGTYTLSPTGSLLGIINPLETITAYAYNQVAEISFYRNGARNKVEDGVATNVQQWYLNGSSTIGDGYYIRASSVGSYLPDTGSLNTWLQLNETRSWALLYRGAYIDCSLFVEISTTAAASGIVSTGYINLISGVFDGGGGGGFEGGQNDGSGAPGSDDGGLGGTEGSGNDGGEGGADGNAGGEGNAGGDGGGDGGE